jgi:hypothetical protein
MPVVRFRFLLPLCNAVIDLLLLVTAVHVVDTYRLSLRQPWPLWKQSYQPVDPLFLGNAYHALPPQPVTAVWVGTVPATILAAAVSEAIFPNGWLGWRLSSPFDLRWVCLHFCFAVPFWYVVGRWTETRNTKRRSLAGVYILLRLVSMPAFFRFWMDGWAAFSGMVLWGIWIAVVVILAFKALFFLVHRLASAAATTKT